MHQNTQSDKQSRDTNVLDAKNVGEKLVDSHHQLLIVAHGLWPIMFH